MMESPLEEVQDVTTSTARHGESVGSGQPSYADVELEQEQGGSVPMPASRNEDSEIDSDEQDKEISVPLSTSSIEGSDTDSGEQDQGRRTLPTTSQNEDSDTDSGSESSDDDLEIDQGRIVCSEDPSGDPSTEVLDDQTLAEEEEGGRVGNAHMQEEQSSPEASAEEQHEPSSSADGVVEETMEIGPEIAESNKQDLGVDVGTTFSASEEEIERYKNAGLQSLNVPTGKETKPSSSQVNVARDMGPESVEFDANGLDDPTEAEDEYVKKGFTCDGNMEEEDKHLREYWTRALQTSTSTGQVVEEIVKVLKDHQKTHDLLCPVCGSCVTRRVILRKRKRSSLISVDRWYRDPLDEGEVEEQGSSLEVMEEEEDPQEYQDTKAFGCLACFSLFVEKGYLLLNQLQADIGSDTFNCLPFFFPPYPWGMTQMKPRSPGLHEEEPSLQESEEAVAVFDVQEPLTADVKLDFAYGICSTLLPDYPWGTMPCLSKGDVIDPSNQSDTAVVVTGNRQDVEQAHDVPQIEDIEESSQPLIKERTCTCGLAPTLLPAYPWGYCAKSEGEQMQGSEDAGASSHPVEAPQPSTNESTCTCGLAPALIPDYPWGYLSKVEEVALQSPSDLEAGLEDSSTALVEDSNLQSVSQPEISEEPPQLCRAGRNCSCGLVPALLPDYPWGFFVKDEGSCNVQTRIEPQAKAVEETKGKMAEDIGSSCEIVSSVLPDYPWGITTEEEVPILREESNSGCERINFLQNGTHLRVGSAVLPSYPWGICSVNQSVHEKNGSAQLHQDPADRDCTCGLGLTMLPKFPWGQTLTVDKQEQTERQQVKYYIEQETKQETRITSTTDLYIVTTSESEKPPQNTKLMIPQQTSQTVQHMKLDQTVTFLNAAVKVDEVSEIKGSPLVSLSSTGFARLEEAEKGRLETGPSTGYAYLEELSKEAESTGKNTGNTQEHLSKHQPTKQIDLSKVSFLPTKPTPTYEQELPESEIEEDSVSLKYPQPKAKPENTLQSIPAETYYTHGKTRPQFQPSGTQFPSFQWSVGKLDAGDLTTPLLKAPLEPEAETFVSVLKPSPGGVDESKSENWLSVFKVSKPSEGMTAPLLSTSGYIEEIEEVKRPVVRPQIQIVTDEAVLDVLPGDLGGTSVGTTAPSAVAVPSKMKKKSDEWDILKSFVYGGLDISIASLGVTSAAAGGNAITRTVVYMGISTLLSGLIEFYHNVLNIYHYHRDHYTEVVGLTLMLHGTVALISYVVFGLLSPLIYAFSYRKTDSRDDKFILCCGVTIVAVTLLALGKARVSNKRYLRTLFAYLSGGVLAAIVGYLTGEHVAELLEEWGI